MMSNPPGKHSTPADRGERDAERHQQERKPDEQWLHEEYLPSTEPQDDELHHPQIHASFRGPCWIR